jgi:hypothetical protein
MSEILIALLLIVPVLLVIAVLSYSHKKKKRKKQDKLSAYVHEVMDQPGFTPVFQKNLVHQLVLIDESLRKILVFNHHETLSHQQLSLDYLKTVKVVTLKETIKVDDQSKRMEVIAKQIGVELVFEKPDKEIFLVVYDHIEHNIFQKADLEKEARELHEIISKAKAGQLVA